jgi:hypothetical protein
VVVRLQIRHDTKLNWEKYNPILASGEIGVETNNSDIINRMKIGDGTHAWKELSYADEKLVHSFGDETIKGDKTFSGTITTSNTIKGTATKAIQDENGVNIASNYQKLLAVDTEITNTTDWNTLTSYGIYLVNLSSWGVASTYHSPNEYQSNLGAKGILVVYANGDFVIQTYYTNNDYPTITRQYIDSKWGSWGTLSTNDNNIVYINKDQTITGSKTFNKTVTFNSGDVSFKENSDCNIMQGSTAFISKTANGDVYLYGGRDGNGTIKFFPNGASSEVSVTIGNDGVIDGKTTMDSVGNVIVDTYLKSEDVDSVVYDQCLPATFVEREYTTKEQNSFGYETLQDLLANKVGDYTDVIDSSISIIYSLTKTGVKIVYGYNVAPLDQCIEKYGTGNYFVFDDVNEQFRLPHDTVDGHCVKLRHFRDGKTSYEFDTDLECTQTGACTSGTVVTFSKPFADTNYTLSCAYSAKTVNGFTPSVTGDYIAKGKIKLSDVM